MLLRKIYPCFLAVLILTGLISCESDYYPKPRGNFRIDLPDKAYKRFDTTFPYTFEYPVYSFIHHTPGAGSGDENFWLNIDFPRYRGRVHLSYKTIDNNLSSYIEDSRNMALKHMPKASGIKTDIYEDPEHKVYGLTYAIDGVEAASPFQFYITDSTQHFIRGALYFGVVPNNDSLSPVIEFIREDLINMIETFEWKETQN